MRIGFSLMVALVLVGMAGAAYAELQNVEVGGQIRIRGDWYSPGFVDTLNGRNPLLQPFTTGSFARPGGNAARFGRWTAAQLVNRAVGGPTSAIASFFGLSFDDDGHALSFVEQRTKLNVKADFTNDVSAFIELDSYDIWGEDFRSIYITGVDGRAASVNDVEVYQAYIEANEMWGYPLRLRIGRQELVFGSEFVLGNNDTSSFFRGLSYDGIRLTYATDQFSVDGFWAKLAETSPTEQDGDVDLYGIYGSYLGFEDITIDAYWVFVRDAAQRVDTFSATDFLAFGEWLEDWFGVDDYDPTQLHTLGLRGAGTYGAFDFEGEVAAQFGDAHSVGFLFSPLTYGDDGADYDEWAANLELGYTFDVNYQPRLFFGAAYFGGNDERDLTFFEWVGSFINPFYEPEASVSFNRLFSDWEYSQFIDATDLSNFWTARGGISVNPTENVEVLLSLAYFDTVDEFEAPPHFFFLGQRFVWLPGLSFLSETSDSELGWELGLYVTYNYTEDLAFKAGWAHFFTDDGVEQGNFVRGNGLGYEGGTSDDNLDYLFFETQISF